MHPYARLSHGLSHVMPHIGMIPICGMELFVFLMWLHAAHTEPLYARHGAMSKKHEQIYSAHRDHELCRKCKELHAAHMEAPYARHGAVSKNMNRSILHIGIMSCVVNAKSSMPRIRRLRMRGMEPCRKT